MLSNSVLAHFDKELLVVLACDASPYGVGAVLGHWLPDGHDFLYRWHFTVYKDHIPLLGLFAPDCQTPQVLSPGSSVETFPSQATSIPYSTTKEKQWAMPTLSAACRHQS